MNGNVADLIKQQNLIINKKKNKRLGEHECRIDYR